MPVKVIVNGFFRSGTTVVWRILRDSNRDWRVFYEPCHEGLVNYLHDKDCISQIHPWHKMMLWDEYYRVPGLIENIENWHPRIGFPLPLNIRTTLEYVGIFHALKENCILQTNRWHFMLGPLATRYGCGIVHIVRNPYDVFRSICRLYRAQGKWWAVLLKRVGTAAIGLRAFRIGVTYEQLRERHFTQLPPLARVPVVKNKTYVFKVFVVVWVLCNFLALRDVYRKNGSVIVYEKLVSSPSIYKKLFKEKYGLDFQYEGILCVRGGDWQFLKCNEIREITAILEEFGVKQDCMDLLLSTIR